MKIDVSEIYGDDESDIKESAETIVSPPVEEIPEKHIPTPEEFDRQFVVEEDVERSPHFEESHFIVEKIAAVPPHSAQETQPQPMAETSVDVAPLEPPPNEIGQDEPASPEVFVEEVETVEAPAEGIGSAEPVSPNVDAEEVASVEVSSEPHAETEAERPVETIDFGTFNAKPFALPTTSRGFKPTPLAVPSIDRNAVHPGSQSVPTAPLISESPQAVPAMIEDAEESDKAVEVKDPPKEMNPREEEARLQRENEYLALYDQFRLMIHRELLDLVGEKKTLTMLNRTLEATRNKNPDYFRNANWDADGNLIEDGSMDIKRLIHNKTLLDPSKADEIQDRCLRALLEMRFLALEKGMGADMRTKVHLKMKHWCLSKRDHEVASGVEPVLFNRLLAMLD